MWHLSTPWWELVLRATVIYFLLLILLRVTGKRQVGQMSPFDVVLLLILSNAVQNAMNAGDESLTGGVIMAVTLVVLNYIVSFIAFRSRLFEKLIEGEPQILIRNGEIFKNVCIRCQITPLELETAIRNGGCESVGEVQLAVLENTGKVSVIRRKE
ncbi:MAG TPA: YetF domain-containing protein [Candidatus Limnocylindria bacterium]|jgi:uncharacterized membrane protein YcaP (DUF421 family)|nr:YetF domain-containing protein [Candidatus Limnocylindria bacterium]